MNKTDSNDSGVHFSIESTSTRTSTNSAEAQKPKMKVLEETLGDENFENGIFNPEFTINDIKAHFENKFYFISNNWYITYSMCRSFVFAMRHDIIHRCKKYTFNSKRTLTSPFSVGRVC